MTDHIDIAHLRTLRAAGTQGEWVSGHVGQRWSIYEGFWQDGEHVASDMREGNAILIAAAVNHLLPLCDAVESIRAERDTARAEVERLREERFVAAAWVLDRAEQYDKGSGTRAALDDLMQGLADGEHLEAAAHGELDEPLGAPFIRVARAALKKDDPVAKAKTSDGSVSQQAVTGGDLSVASVASATPNDSARRTAEAVRLQATAPGSPTLNDFHAANWRRMHEAFAPPHSLTALVVCVQEEIGELASAVLGVTGEKRRKAHLTNADVLDAVADAVTYLSLVASAAGCEDLETLLYDTFDMVSDRAGSRIKLKGGKR